MLYWVDIHGCRIHRFDPSSGSDTQWQLAENVGSLGLRSSGGAVVALRSGFHLFDFATGATTPIVNPIAGKANLRFNDGRCDRQGRFWSGTVNEKREPGTAAIYRLDAELHCTPVVEGITVANTIAWSPDGDADVLRVLVGARRSTRANSTATPARCAIGKCSHHSAPAKAHPTARPRTSMDASGSRITTAAASRVSVPTARSIASFRCPCRDRRAARSAGPATTRCTSRR